MNKNFFQKHGDSIVVALVLCAILGFIFNYIPLDLLLLKTTTAGGDTGAHTYPAQYMYDYLFPHFKLVGWAPGWYGGFPIFQFYFPLPFALIAALGMVFSVQIAFKLVTFLAIILIPLSAFFLFRLLRFSKLESSICAIFMLPFLFMEANSMWGANIPSTFAGEFSYGLGFALSLVYLGLLYRGIEDRAHMLKCALLLGVIGITHAYDLLWAVLSSVFVLFGSDFKRRFAYWFQVNAIAFLLISFWVIPWVYYGKYSTAYGDFWNVGLKEIFPKIFWPFYVLALIGIVSGIVKKEKRIFYFVFSIAAATFYFFFSEHIGGVNIRFVPFVQVMLLLLAASSFTLLFNRKLRGLRFVPIIILLLTLLWVQPNIKFIGSWAKWNYEGFEKKNVWPQFSGVNDFLNGTEDDPRVVYEHSDKHNAAGTTRAFELLPLFSGRSTLEGLYMQSSPSSPFVFYIQSEISKAGSCPFPGKRCTSFNLSSGFEHLKLFNVKHFVAISDEVKGELRNHTSYKLVFESQPYEVFELLTNETGYVVIPEYKPVFFPRENWQNRSYELFPTNWDVPIVFDADVKEEPAITREVVEQNCVIESEVKEEEILFNTTCVGMPHLIKISYFPRWKSENGEKIHLVSPSFMLIYPEKEQVRLYFGRTWVENSTLLLSVLGWVIIIAYRPLMNRLKKSKKLSLK